MKRTHPFAGVAVGLATLFGGASAGPGWAEEPMSVEAAVGYAVEHNPRVAGAAAAIREAKARASQRRAERGPQLGMSNYIYRQGPVVPGRTPGALPAVPEYRWNVGVYISQVIVDFGRLGAARRSEEKLADAARFDLTETKSEIRLVVTAAFYNVHRARALAEVATERKTAAAEQLRVSTARFEQNVSPRFDVLRAEAELAGAEQDVIVARNEIEVAESAFNTALGREITAPVVLAEPAGPAELQLSFDQVRGVARSQRPQILAMRMRVAGRNDEVRSRRSEAKPQISFSATYDRPNPGGFASTDHRYSAGLTMSFPLFDSGLIRGRVRESEARRDRERELLEEIEQQVDLEVRQALLDVGEARERLKVAQKELVAARESLRVADVRYRAGLGTTLEVTDAQLAVSRAGQAVANARFDGDTALGRLEAATGLSMRDLLARLASPGAGGVRR